jgi:hypothetical protein
MQEKVQRICAVIVRFLGTQTFFWLVMALFVLESLWITFSFRYPLLFDEHFHFTLIQLYSHHLSPVILHQPVAYDSFGDLAHQGSTFYHYLMSFPYRLVAYLTSSLTIQVIFLRIINIIFFGCGIVLFAQLFKRIKVNNALVNVTLLFFVLLPIVPYLAATINYDNMLFFLVAGFILSSSNLFLNKKVSWKPYVNIVTIGCLATLVKFAFAPIFLTSVVYLSFIVLRRHGKKFYKTFLESLNHSKKSMVIVYGLLIIVSVGLFIQVYLVNMIMYHNPQPSCARTLSAARCSKVPSVQRVSQLMSTKDQRSVVPVPQYSVEWFNEMESTLNITSVNLNSDGTRTVYARPLPVVSFMTFLLSVSGLTILVYTWRSMNKNPMFKFFVVISFVYYLSVFWIDMKSYYQYHEIMAIQPRYLLQVLPLILVLMALAFNFLLHSHRPLKLVMLTLALSFYLNGAGLATHIVRSNESWDWQKPKVIRINNAARRFLTPLIKENSNL